MDSPEALHDAARAVFDTPPGRLVLEHLKRFTGVDRDRFHIDPHQHAYNAGRASVLREIFRVLKEEKP